MSKWIVKRAFMGIISLTILSIVVFLKFEASVDIEHPMMIFDLYTDDKHKTFATIYGSDKMTKNSSREDNVQKATLKLKCYHLKWNESALTQDVYKKCGFISVKRYMGRTGNHMFQIAALFGIAHDLDLIPVISPSCPLLEYYNLPNVMRITLTNIRECEAEKVERTYTKCSLARKNMMNMTITGFRQSWKYFKNIEDSVAKIFRNRFKSNSLLQAANFINKVSNSRFQIVGIHIRRTDIHKNRVQMGSETADLSYFNKTMSYFKLRYEHVRFIVISDDMRWGKANLQSGDIFYSPFKNPGHDLALMSLCDHMIITYGTFGWWGSWLANGTTVTFLEKHKGPPKVISDSEFYIHGTIGIGQYLDADI